MVKEREYERNQSILSLFGIQARWIDQNVVVFDLSPNKVWLHLLRKLFSKHIQTLSTTPKLKLGGLLASFRWARRIYVMLDRWRHPSAARSWPLLWQPRTPSYRSPSRWKLDFITPKIAPRTEPLAHSRDCTGCDSLCRLFPHATYDFARLGELHRYGQYGSARGYIVSKALSSSGYRNKQLHALEGR